jgi:3-dehydroquinate synthase
VVVSNPTVFALHGERFIHDLLPHRDRTISLLMGDGERFKSQKTVNRLYDALFDLEFERGDVLVAFGGGVVGDTAGYVAATFKRGVRFIQSPTTLLAMADAAIGGKVGINHERGKNQIGAFFHPRAVIINADWLGTLGSREMVEGLAEIVKAGFLSSDKLLKTAAGLEPIYAISQRDDFLQVIREAITFKARIVSRDPYESGVRAVLNFGHTFAHAIETAEGYRRYRHGEALLAGMVAAIFLSHTAGRLGKRAMQGYLRILRPLAAYLKPLRKNAEAYLAPMPVDKKIVGGRLRFVLLEGIGRPVIREVRSMRRVREAVEFMQEYVNHRGEM